MSLKKLGRYDLTRVLGKGAMGMVYEGKDPNLDRRVAIKTIKVENLTNEEAAEYEVRFRTEARSAARLQHPNIVSVYDSDRDAQVAYLVMEFIQGEDLKHHLDHGEVYTLEQTLGIMNDLLSALDYAHRQNIVHRDIKPANLLMEASGRAKLTDFGVARIQDSGDATRTQGSMVGTLKYMSPEQVQGQPIDSRTDLFAAGVVLYQLLTGRRPFDGGSDFDIIQQIVGKPHLAPSVINPLLPEALDGVVARALAKSRNDRFASAQEFNQALQTAAREASDTTIAPPSGPPGSGRSSTWGSLTGTGSTSSGTSSNTSGTSGSVITQELELVYWKDIKESEDVDDFQGFLQRFPTGIYADLARRRLKKLLGQRSEGSSSGTRGSSGTILVTRASSADAQDPAVAGNEPTMAAPARTSDAGAPANEDEATRAYAAPTADRTLAPVAASTDSSGAAAPESTTGADAAAASVATSVPASGTPDAAPASSAGSRAAPAPEKSGGSSRTILIGAALAILAGIGYAVFSPGKPPVTATTSATAESPAVIAAPAASEPTAATKTPPPVPASAKAEGTKADSGKTDSAKVDAAAAKKQAKETKTTAKPGTPETTSAGTAPRTTAANESASSQSNHATPATTPVNHGDPAKICEGKSFFSYQGCMTEQCAKPEFANAAICEQRRTQEQQNLKRLK
jgi:serine/threonine-protein kinase